MHSGTLLRHKQRKCTYRMWWAGASYVKWNKPDTERICHVVTDCWSVKKLTSQKLGVGWRSWESKEVWCWVANGSRKARYIYTVEKNGVL